MVAPIIAGAWGAAVAAGGTIAAVATAPATLIVGGLYLADQGIARVRDEIYGGDHQSLLSTVVIGDEDSRTFLGKQWDSKIGVPLETSLAERKAELVASEKYKESREVLQNAFPGAGESRDIGNPFALEQ